MSIIKIESLTHLYGKGTPFQKTALDNINLEIEQGELVGVIGHTGSGKSTLIQHLNGLLKPDEGKILIDGVDIWASKEILQKNRFKVGLVFQYPEYQLFEETVYKDIAFGPTNIGMTEAEIKLAVEQACDSVGVTDAMLKKSPFELSGGQKRRVAIAGVMAMKPQVLILDEPTAGLDPKGRDTILNLVQDYHKNEKNTVLLVSHSMEDIARYSTKVLIMNNSKVHFFGDVNSAFSKSQQIDEIGLALPQITKVFHKLHELGYEVEPNTYDLNSAKNQIIEILNKKGKL